MRLGPPPPSPAARVRVRVDRGPALLLLGLTTLAGCGKAEVPLAPAPAPAPVAPAPAGTILTVHGTPLSAAEAEALADDVAQLYPGYSRQHARRLALTGELLPRLAGRALAPEAWQAAREACAAFDPQGASPRPMQARGTFAGLGLLIWSEARRLTPGEWGPPLELFGRFVRLRLVQREPAADPRLETLELEIVEFPYLEAARARELLEEAIDRAELEIVDPAWREVVPESWQQRMRPDRP